jgi:DNA-binding XRE family transcriptional regulator
MFKTEEQINARLNSEKNLVNRFARHEKPAAPAAALIDEPVVTVIPLEQPGNKEGKVKLNGDQRNEIAYRARVGETQISLAREFGVSQSAIGEIEQGRTKVNESQVQEKIDQVHDVAMEKLLGTLGFLTSDKMEKCKAVELSVIASNMSKIVGNVRAKDADAPKVIVQLFAPELKQEQSYKTIDV